MSASILTRRGFIGALLAAPAIVQAHNLMPLSVWRPFPRGPFLGMIDANGGEHIVLDPVDFDVHPLLAPDIFAAMSVAIVRSMAVPVKFIAPPDVRRLMERQAFRDRAVLLENFEAPPYALQSFRGLPIDAA